jgi:hypothetical protein
MRKIYSKSHATIFATVLALPLCMLIHTKCAANEAANICPELPCTEAAAKLADHSKRARSKGEKSAKKSDSDWVRGKVVVKAPVRAVWYSVHEERRSDPDLAYSKVLEKSENEATLEQKFVLIPFFGSSVCVMKDIEIPYERIDYHLIKSDRFKAMEGSWVLTPSQDGKSTTLELSSHIDTGMPLPRCLVNATIARKIDRRLSFVKKMAEGLHTGVVAHNH